MSKTEAPMLDPWIIEEIRRREEQERRPERPVIEAPRDYDDRPRYPSEDESRQPSGQERGVSIIDFTI